MVTEVDGRPWRGMTGKSRQDEGRGVDRVQVELMDERLRVREQENEVGYADGARREE